ncbi:hypothetical protein HAX54_045876, partial [Datura stramonium]|nr:hypothetical protein [Datura stramonium]
ETFQRPTGGGWASISRSKNQSRVERELQGEERPCNGLRSTRPILVTILNFQPLFLCFLARSPRLELRRDMGALFGLSSTRFLIASIFS